MYLLSCFWKIGKVVTPVLSAPDIHHVALHGTSSGSDIHHVALHETSSGSDIHHVALHETSSGPDIHDVVLQNTFSAPDIHHVALHRASSGRKNSLAGLWGRFLPQTDTHEELLCMAKSVDAIFTGK